MNFTKVIINNFLTIGRAEINLKERGLLLIQGNNKDDSSADSNGAGKSSIADAICWALYGVTARGVSTDAVVNKTAKKDCHVELCFEDAGHEYMIVRHRKHTTNKNATLVFKANDPGMMATELHKGTEKETQEVVNALIGCSLDVFQAAVYAGQEKMPDLPAMTDKQLKLMIEEAAGTEVLARAHTIARERLNAAKLTYTALEREHNVLASQHVSVGNSIIEQETAHATFEAERKPNAKHELTRTVPLNAKIVELGGKIDAEELKDRGKELRTIITSFAALKGEREEQDRLEKVANEAERHQSSLEARARIAKQSHTDTVEALRTVEDKVGTACGECGKDYCAHDVESVKRLREEDVAAAATHLREVVEEYKLARASALSARDAATKHKASMTDVSAMAARQKVLQDELAQIEVLKKEKTALEVEVEKCKTAAGVWLKKVNPYTASVEMLKKQLQALNDEIDKKQVGMRAAEEKVELLEDAVKVYGPAGVRAHILDLVTPYLNDRTSHYLSSLADDNIHAVWNTLTTNAKGELKEKFNIEVKNDMGAESFEGLSGGEKRKVRLACAMALQDMVASRATKPINIFIADEVDHALDESGLERLMGVLNEKAKERGTVLVISHNSLADWCDNVITVEKISGYAKVSGAV
jgi:DNA repair exonuclease SbcCD ATPase subunit